MASLFDKVQTLISANLHALVDRALESNSISVLDEHVRTVERHLEALEDSAATIGGNVKTMKRKYEEISAQADNLDRNIDTLIIQGKDDLAAAAQAELNTKQELAQEYYEQWQAQEGEYKKILNARMKLEARLTRIKQEREQLRTLIDLAETKKVMTKSIKSLADLQSVGDDEITALTDQIRTRLDQEDARLEIASAKLTDQIDEVIGMSEVENQLEERRRRLKGGEA